MKAPSYDSRTSALTVFALLTVGVVALSIVAVPAGSLFREVTLFDLLAGANPVDLPSLAYTVTLILVGLAATLIGLLLLTARLD
ncbi:hypothetical protein [Haloplanus sp. C73]|uniref:hypothetical protein n=1 Tax=Haloplanus sp. C73 TaxID=3421641 RepID=UPI003EB7A10D